MCLFVCFRYCLSNKYGSERELRSLIDAAHNLGLNCCADIVLNHRCGVYKDAMDQWTIYEAPQWGPWAVVSNNLQGYKGAFGCIDTGVSVHCAPDIDHTNTFIQEDILLWINWLHKHVGFDAFRIDMAGGYAAKYQES